jgi:hypothetical protein
MCIEFSLGFSALEWWKRSNHASFVSRPKGMVNARGWEKCPEVLDGGSCRCSSRTADKMRLSHGGRAVIIKE